MTDKKAEPVEQRVESVERALTILEAFADGRTRMPLGEIAARTGLYRSTILRLSASLERFGYLHRDDDGEFRLGPSLWRLGVHYQNGFNLGDFVRPVLRQLVDETGETAAFYIRERSRRIVLYRLNGQRLIRSHLEEGAELPLDRGASAHVLVAYTGGKGEVYDQVRAQGFGISKGERDPETAAVAVPVFRSNNILAGSLAIIGPISRFDQKTCAMYAEILAVKAATLSRTLGQP